MSEKSLNRHCFPQSVLEGIGYYVYRLIDPRNGSTFYVGKGSGNRVLQHVAEASGLPDRASLKLDRIREIESAGFAVQYIIHRHGLTEPQALLVEAALIDAYEELSNVQLGHATLVNGLTTVDDLIALYDGGPADIDVPAVLVNLRRQCERGLTPDQLYARARGYWSLQTGRHPNVKYGFAVAFGLISEVYRIDGWERFDVMEIRESGLRLPRSTTSKSAVRYAFHGTVASEIRERFVGKSVIWASQSSFVWINC